MARYNIPLSYGLYNIFQRYWWGQGDPLYAVLSRRGHSVDWVDVEMSRTELDRLHEVAEEILTSGEPQEKRVAKQFLRSSKREGYYRNFKVATGSAARVAARWLREARSWTPEGRVVAIDSALSDAEAHLGLLLREAPHASRVVHSALKHVEIAAQIVGRDLAREMSLPSSRRASRKK